MNDGRSSVAALMGSDSDRPLMRSAMAVLERLGDGIEVGIASAHRTPVATASCVEHASSRGCAVFVAGAEMTADLAGAVAAHPPDR